MAVCTALIVVLSGVEESVLTARARSSTSAHRDVIRARIVLAAAHGVSNNSIAAGLGVHVDTVRKWRRRFATGGLPGLEDAPRSGRPAVFTPVQVAEVKALACTLPAETGAPLSRWSSADLAAEAITRGLAETISAATVRRWLGADAIKPWQHRSWIFPRDPDFAIKATRVLDLYARRWKGQRLRADEYVISADEKSQLQALQRRHRGQPPAPGQTRRVEFEYRRGGTLAYFAAYDVHRAHVLGRIAPKTGIEPFTDLVAQVMTTEPYASARRVFWVVDNGSSHNGARSVERMQTTWPTTTLVHLPIHASWLNQVEIYFSILQRKAISPNDFADLDHLAERILSFQDRYNSTAAPFDWTYTRDDLNTFLKRLDLHAA
ncbi:transposase [Mycolicibacterium mucogenicum]|jgi:transposase|uniref:Transposase n=1 Tax=Mycolicibacterium mucogenicum TaxID=56689 RepID=A0A1A0N4F3_MYCMU|nr:IS630 family transposase [Mycolicibacterium mucogenicum]OBA92201.1 transposase [Mycolicibacterium mucogenicum]